MTYVLSGVFPLMGLLDPARAGPAGTLPVVRSQRIDERELDAPNESPWASKIPQPTRLLGAPAHTYEALY